MSRSRRCPRLRFAAVSTAAVAALTLAGCGGGSSGAASGASRVGLIAASAAKTTEATSARMSMTMSFEGAETGSTGTIGIDGAVDFRTGDTVMEMSGDALGGLGLGSVGSGTGPVEVRMVDGVMYMGARGLAAEEPVLQGKEWIRFDVKALADRLGVDAGSAGALDQSDLTGSLDALRGVSGDVEEVGHEKVRGADTTHYRAEIDPEKALDEVPEAQREQAAKALEKLGGASLPVDVWIDGDGRTRKLSMTVDSDRLGVDAPGGPAKATVTYELYDFGVEVDATAPPAETVLDLGEMFSGLAEAFGADGTAN